MRIETVATEEEREEELLFMMRNSIRCCISCILPCGALDVIRIVHSNGRVEEISGSMIKASDIMKAHPKHVLKKPSSPSSQDGVVPKIVVVPPDALLQRGKIYFLMPLPSPPPDKSHHRHHRRSSSGKKQRRKEHSDSTTNNSTNKKMIESDSNNSKSMMIINNSNDNSNGNVVVSSDRYLTDILSEKLSTQRDRRRGRVAVWRPHLESISESPTDL